MIILKVWQHLFQDETVLEDWWACDFCFFFFSSLSPDNKRQHWSLSVACMWPLPLNMVVCPLFFGLQLFIRARRLLFSPWQPLCCSHCAIYFWFLVTGVKVVAGLVQSIYFSVSLCVTEYYWLVGVVVKWKFDNTLNARGSWLVS